MSAVEDQREATEWARRIAATVACPYCGKPAGQLCRSWWTHTTLLNPHPSRVAAAVAARRS